MKKILIFIALAATLNSYAINFDEMIGCFKSISMNGKQPNPGPIDWRNQTTFEKYVSRTYKDVNSNQILDIFILNLFQGYNSPYYLYSPVVFFKDMANKYIEDVDYMYYEVDTDVYLGSYDIYKKVDHFSSIEVTKKGNVYTGVVYFKSKHRNFNRKIDFVIAKQDCFDDEI